MNEIDELIERTLRIYDCLEKGDWDIAIEAIAVRDEMAKVLFSDEFVHSMTESEGLKYRQLVEENKKVIELMESKKMAVENKLSEFNKSKKAEKIYKNI